SWAVGFLGWLPATGLMPPVSRHEPQQVAASIAEHALWHCRGECFQVVAPASLESIFRNTVAIRCERGWRRSFWVLASFRLSHRVVLNLLLRQSLTKTQKSSPRMATEFLQTLSNALLSQPGVFQVAASRRHNPAPVPMSSEVRRQPRRDAAVRRVPPPGGSGLRLSRAVFEGLP